MKGKLNFGINLLLAVITILAFALAPSAAHASQPAQKAPAAPGDGKWDRRFTAPGTNARVRAIAVSGSDVYVGGDFTQVGGMNARRIAKWDSLSQTWSTLAGGVGNFVHDIAVSGPYVFVGGDFTDVSGRDDIQYIAMWDNTARSWSPLGDGVNGQVRAIAVKGSIVYVGGLFTEAGGLLVNGIAIWDMLTQSWSRLGCGVKSLFQTPKVYEITLDGNIVHVGGSFGQVGDVWNSATETCVSWKNASNIATWDGDSWSTLGAGVNSDVNAIAVSGTDVYVGGSFTDAAGIAEADSIARWDGSNWSALGIGLVGPVQSLTILGADVYVGGGFLDGGGILEADRIARWDGSQWNALGTGMTNTVFALAVSGTDIYAGGSFGKAGGGLVNEIARWDGSRWFSLGAGLVGIFAQGSTTSAEDIFPSGDDIYAGGNFKEAGGAAVKGIARWDGSAWWPLGIGFNDVVEAVAVNGPDVYAGGLFTKSSDLLTTLDRIARWDGSQWNPVGTGLNGPVYAIAILGTDVYVGGAFTNAGGVAAADRIARWDGSQWLAVGSGLNSTVTAIEFLGTDIYVGGDFTNAGGIAAADHIARWDGLNWQALGGGLSSTVSDIAVLGSDVYVGGAFLDGGGIVEADLIARWDGSSWSALGSGIPSVAVYALAVLGDQLYVGGEFSQAGGVSASNIARWDGSSWSALGSGTGFRVKSLAATDTDVYAGGLFPTAGGKRSLYFGRYTTENTPPVLSYPSPVPTRPGGSRTVNPSQGPSDDEAVASIDVQSVTPAFAGSITVNDATGVVSIAGAKPKGSFTVTIRATDDEGLSTDASFTLNVTDQTVCALETRIIASDGLAGDQFGYAVAIEGDTLVVGAPSDDESGAVNRGAVYVYVRQGTDWVLQQKLSAGDGTANDYFGLAVDISGESIIVSAPGSANAEVASTHPGKAYIFVRDGVNWSQQDMLVASDGAVNDQFGWSVGLSGNYAVVGARLDDSYAGSAYVFFRSGTTWGQQKKLKESTGNLYGWSVAIESENTIAVGAPGDENGAGFSQGAVYVYTRSNTQWNLQQRLLASTPGSKAAFGRSVALSGETLAVGADLDDVGGYVDQGAAYLFTRSGSVWSEQQKLAAADGAKSDSFGSKVAINGDHFAAGARLANVAGKSDQGAAYTFNRSGANWIGQQKLTAGDGAAGDRFGNAVALSESRIAVGALLDNIGAQVDQGSVYLANCWLPDLIFADGFESGNLLNWAQQVDDGGDLLVTSPAALVGAKGMRALIDDNNPIYVADDSPEAERIYRARFYFDPNSITMAAGNLHNIFSGLEDPAVQVVRVELRRYLNNYEVRAAVRDDANAWTSLPWVQISDAPHVIELQWRASLYAGANNGALVFWVDGSLKAQANNLDNDTYRIDWARLGALAGIDTGTRGTYYFDAFRSHRKSYIGP